MRRPSAHLAAAALGVAAACASGGGCTEALPAENIVNNYYVADEDSCLECVIEDVLDHWLEENFPDELDAGPTPDEPDAVADDVGEPDDPTGDVVEDTADDEPDDVVDPSEDTGPPDEEDADEPPDEEDPVEPLEITLVFEDPVLSGIVLAEPEVEGGAVILGVEFYIDGERLDTDFIPPYSFQFNTAEFADGPHTVSVFTGDTEGQVADDVVAVTFDNTPPDLSFTLPAEGTELFFEDGTLQMSTQSDDINPLEQVTFRANGLLVGDFDEPPYEAEIAWEDLFITEDTLPKNVFLQFYARDELGLETEVTYNITVHRRFFWQFDTFGEIWAEAVALPDGNLVFGNKDNKLIAVTPQGTEEWTFSTNGPIVNAPVYDPASSRILLGDLDGQLHGVTPTGGSAWTQDVGTPPGGVVRVVGGTGYFAGFSGKIMAFNPSNGSSSWEHFLPDFVFSSPAVTADGTVYIGCQDKSLYAVKNGSEVWSQPTGGVILSSPVIGSDGSVYVGSNDGWMYAFHPDGSSKWVQNVGGELWGEPYIDADNNLYVLSISKFVTKLEPIDGAIQWETKTEGLSYGGPVPGPDGTLYVGTTAGSIFALEPLGGDVLWQNELGGTFHARPLVHQDKLFIGSVDRNLYALHLVAP